VQFSKIRFCLDRAVDGSMRVLDEMALFFGTTMIPF
jgi:hypothetical protein